MLELTQQIKQIMGVIIMKTTFNENSKVDVIFDLKGVEDFTTFLVTDLVDLKTLQKLNDEEQQNLVKEKARLAGEDVMYEYVATDYDIQEDEVRLIVYLNKEPSFEQSKTIPLSDVFNEDPEEMELNIEQKLDEYMNKEVSLITEIVF